MAGTQTEEILRSLIFFFFDFTGIRKLDWNGFAACLGCECFDYIWKLGSGLGSWGMYNFQVEIRVHGLPSQHIFR